MTEIGLRGTRNNRIKGTASYIAKKYAELITENKVLDERLRASLIDIRNLALQMKFSNDIDNTEKILCICDILLGDKDNENE